ncbi:uncharacterized protein BX664DRAFT_340337 [Halteromyces radiatus]|uniref:uncharacterized protein n=1 Tax=Halteromyces radiatus TaxID=101107 RepID=UPI00221EAF3C|nr:uncharacterized protein BX664DRAFT_340337 [Halteromyces radiatus]KAI8081412.1 hypothetical protein BX664DRAFT_340337 [Halteromyces radiatus]
MLLLILCLVQLVYSRVMASFIVPVNSPELKYIGRWQVTSQGIQVGWPGAYLQTIVHSTQLRLLLAQPTSLLVKIDHFSWVQYNVSLQQQQQQQYIELNLDDSKVDWTLPHKLTIVSTEVAPLHLVGLALADNGSVLLPSASRVVEFIGHDLMLNTARKWDTNQTIPDQQFAITDSFPWLVSDLLGIDHIHIAYSGATLLDDDTYGKLGMQTRYFDWSIFASSPSLSSSASAFVSTSSLISATIPSSSATFISSRSSSSIPSTHYDFTSYIPSVIVLLLGRYDEDISQYRIDLVRFLGKIRQQYQVAPILVMSEPLGEMVQSTQAAVHQCNDQGDQQIFYVDTTGWLHYNNSIGNDEQLILAQKLAPMIQAKLAIPPLPLPDPLPNPSLPDDWQTMDVGNQGLRGSVTFDAGSSFTLWGSGTSLNGHLDAFRFVYQSLSGKGAIEATIQSHATFSSCAKAGIMLREHLALGSAYVSIGLSPEDGLFIRTRDYNFNNTQLIKKSRASPPYRIRLERTSDHAFIAQTKRKNLVDNDNNNNNSEDLNTHAGDEWETMAIIPNLSLAQDIYVGLFVTSCDNTVVSVANFTEVSIQGNVGRAYVLHPHRFIDQSSRL